MKNVYLFEIADVTAQQVKLPYSTGLIWGHCHLNETIVKNYKLFASLNPITKPNNSSLLLNLFKSEPY